jgi:GWxTD domain-containing protein
MKKYATIIGILVCALLSIRAFAENFAGEESLVAKLPSQRLSEYLELKILMNPLQMRQYLMLSTERERSRWIRRFWAELDPTPASDENERRVEHEKRIAVAREYFRSRGAPGWDDRGEAIIRWGLPSCRMKTSGDVTLSGVTPPGEVWYYHRYAMVVDFKDFTLTGHYSFSAGAMDHPLTSLDEIRKLARSSELSRSTERMKLKPVEFLDPQEFRNVLNNADESEIDYWRDMYIHSEILRQSAMNDVVKGFEYEKVKADQVAGNFDRFLSELPVVHQCDIDQNTLPLHFDIVGFKGAGRALRTEVSFEVPANELAFAPAGDGKAADVEFTVVAMNYEFKSVARGNDRIKPVLPGSAVTPATLLPGQVVLSLEPGYYRIGIEAFDRISKKKAAAVKTVRLAGCGGSPALSDIQFASGLGEAAANTRFVKNGLLVVPHPCRAYRKPFPLHFYFEIYGLDADAEGRVFYRIEYRIIPLEKKRWGPVLVETPTTISSSFETSGYGPMQPQRLSIATDELWEGPFRLDVTVTDRRSFRTATKSADFSILK